jgi:hypothetical protein
MIPVYEQKMFFSPIGTSVGEDPFLAYGFQNDFRAEEIAVIGHMSYQYDFRRLVFLISRFYCFS